MHLCTLLGFLSLLKSASPYLLAQEALEGAISDAGFNPTVLSKASAGSSDHMTLRVDGMTCSSCSSAAEAALKAVDGVQSAAVNLLAGRAEVKVFICLADVDNPADPFS